MYCDRDVEFEREEMAWSALDERLANIPEEGVKDITDWKGRPMVQVTNGEQVMILTMDEAERYANALLETVREARKKAIAEDCDEEYTRNRRPNIYTDGVEVCDRAVA